MAATAPRLSASPSTIACLASRQREVTDITCRQGGDKRDGHNRFRRNRLQAPRWPTSRPLSSRPPLVMRVLLSPPDPSASFDRPASPMQSRDDAKPIAGALGHGKGLGHATKRRRCGRWPPPRVGTTAWFELRIPAPGGVDVKQRTKIVRNDTRGPPLPVEWVSIAS